MFRPWVFAALAGVLAYVVQLSPIPGIFLMMGGAILWPGMFMHLAMVLLAVDCWRGEAYRPLLFIPAAFYLYGLGDCALSVYDAARLKHHLATMDERQVIPYDRDQRVILFTSDRNRSQNLQRRVQSEYGLDLAFGYDPGSETQFAANYVLPRESCPDRNAPRTPGIDRSGFHINRASVANACMLRTQQRPDRRPITVQTSVLELNWRGEELSVFRTEISDGAQRAILHTARTQIAPPVFFLIAGCALNSARASWVCGHQPMRLSREVGGNGRQDSGAQVDFVAKTLGLEQRTVRIVESPHGPLASAQAHIDFAPDPHQSALLRDASGVLVRRLQRLYSETLPDLIANPRSVDSATPHVLITASPEANAAHADFLLDGMSSLTGRREGREVRRVLASGLITMTDEEWMTQRPRMLRLLTEPTVFAESPGLLVRAGDYGVDAVPILVRAIQHEDRSGGVVFGAALGLCRVGAAANTLEVRAALLRHSEGARGRQAEAIFIAFLRLGAPEQAMQMPLGNENRPVRLWRDYQLAQVTPASPRSACAPHERPMSDTMPRDMADDWRPPRT